MPADRSRYIVRGVTRRGRAQTFKKSGRWLHASKGTKGKRTEPTEKKSAPVTTKWYAADDVQTPLTSRKHNRRPTQLKKNISAGTVLIVLAGRFRGKRVVFLKQLPSGLLLVTGPYKVNGVPLRRLNQRYTIATSTQVDISGVDVSAVDDAFFARVESKKSDEFLANDAEKTGVSEERKKMQKTVDSALLKAVASTPLLSSYLNAKFSLTQGQYPHLMKF